MCENLNTFTRELSSVQVAVRLELRHLAMLEAIAETPTLGEAARRLRITPSALSHRLAEAERRVGRPLVARGAGRPELTAVGRRLLPIATRTLRELREVEREAADEVPVVPTVRLAASTICGYQWLPPLMRRLASRPDPIELEVAVDASLDPVGAVRAGTVDLAVVPAAVRERGLRSVPLFDDEMVAVLPAGHPKAARAWLAPRDFLDETYVADATRPQSGREFDRFFRPARVTPTRVLRAGVTEGVLALVGAGLGITILTRLTVAPYASLAAFELRPLGRHGLRFQWHAACRRADGAPGTSVREVANAIAAVAPA
jgi:LysR family transcriptional regulator for metE and metH